MACVEGNMNNAEWQLFVKAFLVYFGVWRSEAGSHKPTAPLAADCPKCIFWNCSLLTKHPPNQHWWHSGRPEHIITTPERLVDCYHTGIVWLNPMANCSRGPEADLVVVTRIRPSEAVNFRR